MILKRMKRRHSRADAIAFCDQLRRLRPDAAFGADIIAGFPTETEAMFQRSLDLVDDCGLTRRVGRKFMNTSARMARERPLYLR